MAIDMGKYGVYSRIEFAGDLAGRSVLEAASHSWCELGQSQLTLRSASLEWLDVC